MESGEIEETTSRESKELLIYRGKHYCKDQDFMEAFTSMYEEGNLDLLDNAIFREVQFTNSIQGNAFMDEFVHYIKNY